ncbi:hypothetical protein TNCT_350651 [Trichonephila clavata]|uniref:Uncharacterized protein n=1 Tax=Trichonephila clavata TaxID=2740835 RepID=A0A8X6L5Q8_TRICU|nr:hypothetical protein TNCT_350651 [Trichonephila clavata]
MSTPKTNTHHIPVDDLARKKTTYQTALSDHFFSLSANACVLIRLTNWCDHKWRYRPCIFRVRRARVACVHRLLRHGIRISLLREPWMWVFIKMSPIKLSGY